MGQSSNSLQNMQLREGGQDSRRGWNAHSKIERSLMLYLKNNCYGSVCSEWELEEVGIDTAIFNLIFKDWKRVEIDSDIVRVVF